MCSSCASEYKVEDLPNNADQIVDAIKALYAAPMGGTGGPLHIVLDDFNVDSLRWCADNAFEADHYDEATLAAARTCLDLLEPLTEAQRGAVISRHWGYL